MRSGLERRLVVLAAGIAALVLGAPRRGSASIEIFPQSGEFQVNTYTQLNQFNPAIAADTAGNFVVVWEQWDTVPQPNDIVARRFTSAGVGLGSDFQVNVFTTAVQKTPAVGRSAAGGFVVVWASAGQDGDGYGIFGRRYNAAGGALAAEFQINAQTTAAQIVPKVAMGSGGDFVVSWDSAAGQDGDGRGVFARRFDSGGTALGAEFQVNEYTTGDQGLANVFRKGDGSFIVTWASLGQDGDLAGAFARRFDSSGSPLGGEIQVNAYTVGSQLNASVAYGSDGFAITWQSQGQDGSGFGIFANAFDSSGVPEPDGEAQLNAFTFDDQFQPVPLAMGTDDFVVVWFGDQQDGNSYGVFARAFDHHDLATDYDVQLNTTTFSAQANARAVATGRRFVVVWHSGGQDGSGFGVFGRRFVLPTTLDVDGDGQFLPLTDGVLILRYGFGFSGATLITGAVGAGCTRCDAPSIAAYLGSV